MGDIGYIRWQQKPGGGTRGGAGGRDNTRGGAGSRDDTRGGAGGRAVDEVERTKMRLMEYMKLATKEVIRKRLIIVMITVMTADMRRYV